MPASIEDLLASTGATVLGVGGAAFAYQIPQIPERAVKVGVDLDDGWPAWAAWCRQRRCPHVPRVDSFQWVLDHAGRRLLYVAVTEALYPSEWAREFLRPDKSLKKRPLDFAARVRASHPAVASMLEAAAAAFPGAVWDMHRANWLERPDGTVVLNDPLAHA